MIVFLNGRFVPERRAVVSVSDRSFLYGDGLFETLCVRDGRPFLWDRHIARLRRGAGYLRIRIPFPDARLRGFGHELIRRNGMRDAVLRLTLSRGVGKRGYSPAGADCPTLVMTLHPRPPAGGAARNGWNVITTSVRLASGDRLARFKTCNKLPQILARMEAEANGADEGLLLNTDGRVAEAASSNLFWVQRGRVMTTPLEAGILAGVTREFIIELARDLGIPTGESGIRPSQLPRVEGAFLSLSTLGIVPVAELNGTRIRQSPIVRKLQKAYALALQEGADRYRTSRSDV